VAARLAQIAAEVDALERRKVRVGIAVMDEDAQAAAIDIIKKNMVVPERPASYAFGVHGAAEAFNAMPIEQRKAVVSQVFRITVGRGIRADRVSFEDMS
jgi:hypothetical protein